MLPTTKNPALPPTDIGDRRISIGGRVYLMLRRELVESVYLPGSPLSELALAGRFGVSRTPIREALLRLSEDGLVAIVPQVGTYVTRISLAKVYDAHFIREALECATVRVATRRQTAEGVERLRSILVRQQFFMHEGDIPRFYETDEELHATLADIGGVSRAWKVAAAEKLQLDRVRLLDVSARTDLGVLLDQHQAIANAVTGGDPDGAVSAMRKHLRDVFERLKPLTLKFADYFEDVEVEPIITASDDD